MIKDLIAASALLLGALPATAAPPTSYTVSGSGLPIEYGSPGTASYSYTLTTDGAAGFLAQQNILDWSLQLTDRNGSFSLNSTNSTLYLDGSLFYATPSSLQINYDEPDYFFEIGTAVHPSFYSVCSSDNCGESGEELDLNTIGYYRPISGTATVPANTTSAVPEPATWAMMIGGFGLVGAAMRRRKVLPAAPARA